MLPPQSHPKNASSYALSSISSPERSLPAAVRGLVPAVLYGFRRKLKVYTSVTPLSVTETVQERTPLVGRLHFGVITRARRAADSSRTVKRTDEPVK